MSPRFTAIKGTLLGQVFPLTGELSIGREVGNGIVIPDGQISRRHARIVLGATGPMVEDLGSANGTLVNDRPVSGSVPIYPGDRVRILGNEFVYEVQDPAGSRPAEVSRMREGGASAAAPVGLPGVRPMAPVWSLPDLSFLTAWIGALVTLIVRYLPWIAGALILICLLGKVVGSGMDALSWVASHWGRQDQPSSSAPAATPPAPNSPPPSGGQEDSDAQIEILSAKVVLVSRTAFPTKLNALVLRWRNKTGHPVSNIIADVQCYDATGGFSITKPLTVVYSGPPVVDGAIHQDTEDTATLLSPIAPSGSPPTSAKLENFTVH